MALLVALLMCFCFSSCGGGDDETTEDVPNTPTPEEPAKEPVTYVDIDYQLTCSEDLLQYVTPRVTYTDADGSVKTVDASDSEWKENKDVKFDVTIDGVSTDAKLMTWTKRVRYTSFPVDKEMTVKYVSKANMPSDDKMRLNKFYHFLSVSMSFVSDNKTVSKRGEIVNTHYSEDGEISTKELITTYVEDLCVPYIAQQDNYSCIIAGADNKTITEILTAYSDKQGILVKSDGTYSLKYEPEPYVAKKSCYDVTYTLNCSEELLKYVTPQVTYTGNDGKAVTFQLTMSDFEVNDKVKTWSNHYHGDEDRTYADGEENATIMKWVKHVHYDNLASVDDEMTVTYIPKEDIGKMRLSHAYHNLSAGFILLDDNDLKTILTVNKIKTSTVEGEKQTRWKWKFMENGNPIVKEFTIDSFIGNNKFIVYSSDGKRIEKTYGELIIGSYKDHQGFHLERNGKYTIK